MQLQTEQSSPSEEYLSDYLYIDTVRLSHYYGQIAEHGLVTQSKHVSKSTSKDTDTLGVKAVLTGSMASESSSEQTVELQVDASYSRPQHTLDALYEAGFIHEGLQNARVGTLFLAKGKLSIFDVRILQNMWQVLGDVVAEDAVKGIAAPAAKAKAKVTAKKQYDNIAAIITKLPHSLQGNLHTDSNTGWFTLKPDCMIINPEDFAFKHGCDLPGDWHMLGIVDALPNDFEVMTAGAQVAASDIENVMRGMLLGLREGFGRPMDRFGITPVMIFRTMRKTST